MPAQLCQGQVRATRNEAYALGYFLRTNRSHELPIYREIPGGIGDVNAVAGPRNLHVSLGSRNFGVTPTNIDIYVALGVAHVDVPAAAVDRHWRAHVGHGKVALFVSDGHRGLTRHHHVHVHADPRIATARGLHIKTIAVRHDFDANAIGDAVRITFVPTPHVLLPVHPNFGLIGASHADIAVNPTNGDARLCGNGLRHHVKIGRRGDAAHPLGKVLLHALYRDNHSDERQ